MKKILFDEIDKSKFKKGKCFMGELSKLPNIGKKVEEQLIQVGINSVDELKKVGAKAAWLKNTRN